MEASEINMETKAKDDDNNNAQKDQKDKPKVEETNEKEEQKLSEIDIPQMIVAPDQNTTSEELHEI